MRNPCAETMVYLRSHLRDNQEDVIMPNKQGQSDKSQRDQANRGKQQQQDNRQGQMGQEKREPRKPGSDQQR